MSDPVSCSQLSQPNRTLMKRPEHAARIACIAAEWTQVEKSLALLIGGVFGRSEATIEGGFSIATNFFAQTTILSLETIRQRLKVVDKTFGALAKGTEFEARWADLSAALNKRSRERNSVIHGNWALSSDYPNDLILIEIDGSSHRYTVRHMDEILDRIIEARAYCHILLTDILAASQEGRLAGTPMEQMGQP